MRCFITTNGCEVSPFLSEVFQTERQESFEGISASSSLTSGCRRSGEHLIMAELCARAAAEPPVVRRRMQSALPMNPWRRLPETPPYVLAGDAPAITAFNSFTRADKRYDLSLYPEPFFGSPLAPVVLLALNPGWSPLDAEVHAESSFGKASRLSLIHALAPYPFLHLQPGSSTPGAQWWCRITRALVESLGFDRIAKHLLCVQHFPYHSPSFGSASLVVPSQNYSQALVRAAIARGAEIVVMRSWHLWADTVPEIVEYRRVHRVRNPRNPALSPRNLGASFNAIASRLAAA
jgi:hypothetical protein